MRCLRHKVEGAIHSQGHVSDWPAQLPKTVLLVGIRESPVWKGKQSGERACPCSQTLVTSVSSFLPVGGLQFSYLTCLGMAQSKPWLGGIRKCHSGLLHSVVCLFILLLTLCAKMALWSAGLILTTPFGRTQSLKLPLLQSPSW